MKCPNCVLGDLQFFMRGELRFCTDEKGRPCGTADIQTRPDQAWMICDTCSANFGVQGWQADGAGEVILSDAVEPIDDAQIEFESESPPPGGQLFE